MRICGKKTASLRDFLQEDATSLTSDLFAIQGILWEGWYQDAKCLG
jgi:hypothetical protein